MPVTGDYLIGPGDEILIRAWGQIDVDYSAVVDRNGTINVPKVGAINVAGIKYQDNAADAVPSQNPAAEHSILVCRAGLILDPDHLAGNTRTQQ